MEKEKHSSNKAGIFKIYVFLHALLYISHSTFFTHTHTFVQIHSYNTNNYRIITMDPKDITMHFSNCSPTLIFIASFSETKRTVLNCIYYIH